MRNSSTKTKVGIIGIGYIGRVYLDSLFEIDGVDVVGIFDTSADASVRCCDASSIDGVIYFNNLDSLLMACNMIIIASPTPSHFDYLMKCIESKIPLIVCEKPICSTPDQADTIKHMLSKVRTRICVSFNLRFLPVVDLLRKISLSDDDISVEISLSYDRDDGFVPGWRENRDVCRMGGAAGDLGCHLLDLVQYIFNDDIELDVSSLILRSAPISRVPHPADSYFSIRGCGGKVNNLTLTTSKIGGVKQQGFKLRIATNIRVVEYSSSSENEVVEVHAGNRRSYHLAHSPKRPEDYVFCGWTDSFKLMLESAIYEGGECASVDEAASNLRKIYSII